MRSASSNPSQAIGWVVAGCLFVAWLAVGMAVAADRPGTVSDGADWWSLQPLGDVAPPVLENDEWSRGAIDRFVLRRLREAGLEPSPPADARALIRRVYFDLIGLPPTPDEVRRFIAEPSDAAYQRMVDELLDRPAYGERWARHWLDVARYGESDGFEYNNPRPQAWTYRDWVIDALNADMPYDAFVRAQLMGDLDGDPAATGFLVAGVYNSVVPTPETFRLQHRQEELEEITAAVGQAMLGLTVQCARCHDHKFDPISIDEYYQFAATFAGVRRGERPATDAQGSGEQSTSVVFAVTPDASAEVMHLYQRGDVTNVGPAVSAGGLAALGMIEADFDLAVDAADGERRRALANWITHRNNPLFTRVMVNRLWHHHFGVGIVDTPNDFGALGGKPSHPQLLDWLAGEFVRQGYRLKPLHRMIVMSATYRQASAMNTGALAKDASNRLLWRYSPGRLDAESLRDALLAVSGQLDPARGGPGFWDVSVSKIGPSSYYAFKEEIDPSTFRRTIYRFSPRGNRNALLSAFDCPDSSNTAPTRSRTTTAQQALSLLNNPFVMRMADDMAQRVTDEVGDDIAAQIDRVYDLALSRRPEDHERVSARELVDAYGLRALCRALFNSNEFVMVR